jgi:DNA-directed RNA polymerase II subunit RPB1
MGEVQQLINYWVLQSSFSIGAIDTVADSDTMRQIESTIDKAKKQVQDLVRQGQMGTLEMQPGRTMIESFEELVNKVLNTARDHAGKSGQSSLDETNSVKAMVTAVSKGSFVHISQIIACVGQQNVEGKRISVRFQKANAAALFQGRYWFRVAWVCGKLVLAWSLAPRVLLSRHGWS